MAEHDDITNALDDNGFTPLHEAAESNSIEDLEELLAGGANPNAKESLLNQTPLHRAAMAGSKDAAERLLQAGADPNIRDVDGDTPLHAALKDPASEDKHLATVSSLISHGARLDLPDKQSGRTPLSLAVASNKIKTAERLLEERVHPNTTDKEGNTTLHLAAARSSAVTQQLLLAGASPHIRNPKDHTPLHQAAMNGKADAAARLLDAGADPNSRTKSGQTPLHFAANGRSPETVGRLIEAGADPSARNDLGSTPLHSAALANCTKSIDRLLKAGADLKAHVPDKLGTPLELAREASIDPKPQPSSRARKPPAIRRRVQSAAGSFNTSLAASLRTQTRRTDKPPFPPPINNREWRNPCRKNTGATARAHANSRNKYQIEWASKSMTARPPGRKDMTSPRVQTISPSILQP